MCSPDYALPVKLLSLPKRLNDCLLCLCFFNWHGKGSRAKLQTLNQHQLRLNRIGS